MKVVTISVNGLRQAADNGFFDWMVKQNADVVCVQDIRGRIWEFDDERYHPPGYEAFFIDAENEQDGGVCIYSRHFPKAIMYGFAFEPADREGRFIQADFDNVSVASILLPCALGEPGKQKQKDDFMNAFMAHLQKTLRKRRQFIFCGNFQTAHLVTDASSRYHKMEVSGFLPQERGWFDEVFESLDYVDAFREINKDKNQYTWYPEWAKGWRKQSGWRTDYQIATPGIRGKILSGHIDGQTRFSDHAPLIMDYDIVVP
ncbi:MAG: exodeoxyribonuclease III [Hahellaceae bacterium]|nr:exodeoxyribonuclease III [Hahellaceae bacterium]MCP5168438.1 exodeoxyribonuclease III [Hahellaceae bacterium]